MVLNEPIESLDFLYIYGIIHAKTAEYTFFSSAQGMFFRTDHIIDDKTKLNKFEKRNCIKHFSWTQQYGTSNELQEKRESTNIWRLNSMLRIKPMSH